MNITPGQKLTIITISEGMANTVRREVLVKTVLPAPEFQAAYVNATRGKQRVGMFRYPGKRTDFHLDIGPNDIVLDGWNRTDIQTDQEDSARRNGAAGGFSFSGNACINLACAAGPEALKTILDVENLNPQWSDNGRGRVLYIPETAADSDDSVPLYPEIQIGHAVMERRRLALAA